MVSLSMGDDDDADVVVVASVDASSTSNSFAIRHKRLLFTIAFLIVSIGIVWVATTVGVGNAYNDTPSTAITNSSAAAMDIISSPITARSNNKCLTNDEGLWALELQTDNYPFETKWELYDSSTNNIISFGPPEGMNYNKNTRYSGHKCLPVGEYKMRWYDLMGDGICCQYGEGGWYVYVNGKEVLRGTSSTYTQQDFTFEIVPYFSRTGTFLIMPRPNDPVMCIELEDGKIYELSNLQENFDYMERGLVSGVSSITLLEDSTIIDSNGTINMVGKAPQLVSGRHLRNNDIRKRQLANFMGPQTVLGVRVIASDGEPTFDEAILSSSIFDTSQSSVSLASQIKACSYDKMKLIKASNRSGKTTTNNKDVSISNGVVTIRLPTVSIGQGDAYMRNYLTTELNELFGVTAPSEIADYVIYCFPPGTYTGARPGEGIAYAYINSWLSVFNDDWCLSSSLLMHEIGHSMNLGHSNEDAPYEDETGKMGYSYPNRNGPRSCFNAAKSWQTGWYKDKSVTVSESGRITCFDGILHGVAGYLIANTVLLKVQSRSSDNIDYYINFNAKMGINAGTQEGGNMITVVSRRRGPRDSYSESELEAKLGSGESYSFGEYTVKVGKIELDTGTADVVVLPSGEKICNTL